jgi:hypothetical protein
MNTMYTRPIYAAPIDFSSSSSLGGDGDGDDDKTIDDGVDDDDDSLYTITNDVREVRAIVDIQWP